MSGSGTMVCRGGAGGGAATGTGAGFGYVLAGARASALMSTFVSDLVDEVRFFLGAIAAKSRFAVSAPNPYRSTEISRRTRVGSCGSAETSFSRPSDSSPLLGKSHPPPPRPSLGAEYVLGITLSRVLSCFSRLLVQRHSAFISSTRLSRRACPSAASLAAVILFTLKLIEACCSACTFILFKSPTSALAVRRYSVSMTRSLTHASPPIAQVADPFFDPTLPASTPKTRACRSRPPHIAR